MDMDDSIQSKIVFQFFEEVKKITQCKDEDLLEFLHYLDLSMTKDLANDASEF